MLIETFSTQSVAPKLWKAVCLGLFLVAQFQLFLHPTFTPACIILWISETGKPWNRPGCAWLPPHAHNIDIDGPSRLQCWGVWCRIERPFLARKLQTWVWLIHSTLYHMLDHMSYDGSLAFLPSWTGKHKVFTYCIICLMYIILFI